MEDFILANGTRFYFGRGRENEIGGLIKKHGGSRVLVVHGEEKRLSAGLLNKIRMALAIAGVEFGELGLPEANTRQSVIEEGIARGRSLGADFIVAVGGGDCFEAARTLAAGFYCRGFVSEIFREDYEVDRALPIGAVVTSPVCGYVTSGRMGMCRKRPDGPLEIFHKDCAAVKPRFALLNPSLLEFSPRHLAASMVNLSARVFERYLLPKTAAALNDRLCESVIATLFDMRGRLEELPLDFEACSNLMWAGVLADTTICRDAPAGDWNLEVIARAFRSFYDCSRAAALSLILTAFMEMCAARRPLRLAQLGSRALGEEIDFRHPETTARRTLGRFRDFIERAGLPARFEDLGGSPRDIPRIIERLEISSERELVPGLRFDRVGAEILLSLILVRGSRGTAWQSPP